MNMLDDEKSEELIAVETLSEAMNRIADALKELAEAITDAS